MTDVLDFLGNLREAADNAAITVIPWLTRRQYDTSTARDGAVIESTGSRVSMLRLSYARADGRLRMLAITGMPGVDEIIDMITRLPDDLPSTGDLADLPMILPVVPLSTATPEPGPLAEMVGPLTRHRKAVTVESRIERVWDEISVVLGEHAVTYVTGHHRLQLRVDNRYGQRANRETWVHGTTSRDVLQAAQAGLDRLSHEVTLPIRDVDLRAGQPVTVEGEVSAQLLGLAMKAFTAEAVKTRRSPFTPDDLGQSLFAEQIDIIDDPQRVGGPFYGPMDDEAVATRALSVIDHGKLRGFLGGVKTDDVPGSRRGHCWSGDRLAPPRPASSNVAILPAAPGVVQRPADIRLIESQGLHMANDITGDFSMACTVVARDGDSEFRSGQVMVTGNVFETLRTAVPTNETPRWSAGTSSFYGSTDLRVEGLTIAR